MFTERNLLAGWVEIWRVCKVPAQSNMLCVQNTIHPPTPPSTTAREKPVEIAEFWMVRGRGFEPLNPCGTRSLNIQGSLDVPELHVRMVFRDASRAFDLASPSRNV